MSLRLPHPAADVSRRVPVEALAAEILADPVHELFVVMGLPRIHEEVRDVVPGAALPARCA